jgi:dephospho-CoA kinase
MLKLIAMCGVAQSGKDTAGKILMEHGYERLSFADPIRTALYTLNPIVAEDGLSLQNVVDIHGWDEAKKQYLEIRRLVQIFGTEVARRQWGQDFWVDLALRKIVPNHRYVITDCRFPNEARAIRASGGQIWKIYRDGVNAVNDHISDNFIKDIAADYVVYNSGSLEDFEGMIEGLLKAVNDEHDNPNNA